MTTIMSEEVIQTKKPLAWRDFAKKNRGVGEADDIWQDLAGRIKVGKIIPILSNSLRDERFMRLFGQPETSLAAFISENWAASEKVNYPMNDSDNLARVAQYHQVKARNPEKAKRDFLDFMVQGLIGYAVDSDKRAAAIIEEKNLDKTPDLLFADLVSELGYPPLEAGEEDLMALMAKLRLPIYITTSYYDFLERALIADGRKRVRSEVCTWSGQTTMIDREHLPSKVEPTADEPLVFHLFGMERYPHTMVLSVDDYLNFLVNIFLRETDPKTSGSEGAEPPIPGYLWALMVEWPLLIMGFHLHDWDFQVLYRVVTAKLGKLDHDSGVIIQVEPDESSGFTDAGKAKTYLEEYFSREAKFRVEFLKPDQFIVKLYKTFKQRS